MAPVTGKPIGVTPQIIDDPNLIKLQKILNSFEINSTWNQRPPSSSSSSSTTAIAGPLQPPLDIDALVSQLNKFQTWRFEEQADLCEWIHPLNVIDAALSYLMQKYPAVLLISPSKNKQDQESALPSSERVLPPSSEYAESLQNFASVPSSVNSSLCTILRFLSNLLQNSINKSSFNSSDELVDLLAAADDQVAANALEALCNLATPPSLHKQQAPEVHQHVTSLHNSNSNVHKRLIALARGWGSRGSGLGLFGCVTADDSDQGQGALPMEAGELTFEFFTSSSSSSNPDKDVHMVDIADGGSARVEQKDSDRNTDNDSSRLVRIHLSTEDIVDSPLHTVESSKQKRRRTEAVPGRTGRGGMETKSTAELFFRCLDQVGDRRLIPEDRLFALLADIRLARGFHSYDSRVHAVESRLRALITILHAHPSQDVMTGYFHAQPELCIELIDLLRPTVSSAAVSSSSVKKQRSDGNTSSNLAGDIAAMTALANSPSVPFSVRTLSLEALTGLVARRDGAGTGGSRQSNVLNELGVAKGQYLGPLPTLIRYSLASLSSFLASAATEESCKPTEPLMPEQKDETSMALDVGLAFVEAIKPPAVSQRIQLERALEFIDSVLTLTSAVVSAPSGTAALTDCGLIPALLSTVAVDPSFAFHPGEISSDHDDFRSNSLLRFITAQAIQIIEGAIVTHNNALNAFHELDGVHILIKRLHDEIVEIRKCRDSSIEDESPTDHSMDCEPASNKPSRCRQLCSSRRVLLFSIVNCLTVVFHQESTSSSSLTPSGGSQLRKPELSDALMEIMGNVDSYGGVLAALTASLLSDVMNSDPHVVHHVHKSGLANSFLTMLMGKNVDKDTDKNQAIPILPAVPELIMAIPNVIAALSLTEDGAAEVLKANPFPALLAVFYHPRYSMPNSSCLLNELTAIVGTGLDEIMRHVPTLRPQVMTALVRAMHRVVEIGRELVDKEELQAECLENDRTYLMQYALNFGQMLEQILHNEDHSDPFVEAGGLDAILDLFPLLLPSHTDFLTHISCLSCTSVCTLSHSTTEDSLTVAFKSIALHCNTEKMLDKMILSLDNKLNELEKSQLDLKEAFGVSTVSSKPNDGLYAGGVLEGVPRIPIYDIKRTPEFLKQANALSRYLRHSVTIQWLANLLSGAIRAGCQRGQDGGSGWGRTEREWKKVLSTPKFEIIVDKLSMFHQSALMESCRIRTEKDFDARENSRLAQAGSNSTKIRFKLRIVCQEGAVVRDGIEIDSCFSVGKMEMGEIVEAFDRCVNSSGVLRYRTSRGWVSELTRGHGREPIAEAIDVWKSDSDQDSAKIEGTNKRIECRIPDLCSVGASVLARLQNSYSELFSSLSRLVIQGVRSLPVRSLAVTQGSIGAHVVSSIRMMTSNIERGFNQEPIRCMVKSSDSGNSPEQKSLSITEEGAAMYLGCIFSHLHSCLFEERRERRMTNVPILLFLMQSDCMSDSLSGADVADEDNTVRFFSALAFVFKQGLADMAKRSKYSSNQLVENVEKSISTAPLQAVGRSVASSLPPSIALLRRFMSGSSITSSPLTSILSRFKGKDLETVLGKASFSAVRSVEKMNTKIEDIAFHPERFVGSFHCKIAEEMLKVWTDNRLVYIPSHILHPLTSFAGEIISSLEEDVKTAARSGGSSTGDRTQGNQYDVFSRTMRRQRLLAGQDEETGRPQPARLPREEHFEANEETLSRLIDMGFNRDHALFAIESTESNRLEVAMEYALSHPPPTAEVIERRRAAREARQRQTEENRAETERGDANAPPSESQGQSTATAPNQGASGSTENEGESGRISESMDIDTTPTAETEKESQNKEATEKQNEDDVDRISADRLETCLRSWVEQTSAVSLNLLSGTAYTDTTESIPRRLDDGKGEGDGEVEALTVVVSSFLLDLCQRYPSDRNTIVEQLLKRLGSQVHEIQDGAISESGVIDGHENSFAALCHATVLFMRALPKSRTAVLEHGLVGRLLSCIQTFIGKSLKKPVDVTGEKSFGWPMWLAPALLLLDVMAQPMAAFADSEALSEAEDSQTKSELQQVREEHKKQATALSDAAELIFSTIGNKQKDKGTNSHKDNADKETKEVKNKGEESNGAPADSGGETSNDKESKKPSGFSAVPSYFPLIPIEASEKCLQICLTLLGKSRKADSGRSSLPPGIVQALLLLLSRVIRTPKMASRCLRMGAAELIVYLPKSCRFAGHTGIVTVILRRLLEDETTLQASMETEIRGTVTKLIRKQRRGFSLDDEKSSIPCRSFMQAATPLICRDPLTFIKAAAMSVSLEPDRNNTSNSEAWVTLVSAERRASYVKAFADGLSKSVSAGSAASPSKFETPKSSSQKRGRLSNASTKCSKSKSPHRSSHHRRSLNSKKSKKEKNHLQNTNKKFSLNGTPVNHITSMLVFKMMALCHRTVRSDVDTDADDFEKYGEENSFLWIADVLNVLADLVLAVPACATAIHKYRPLNSKDRSAKVFSLSKLTHALTGCPQPPKTVVSFLLHHLLPQNRWISKKSQHTRLKQSADGSRDAVQIRKSSYIKSKVSQSSARLLVALVARAGEGRRRVVADLAFALSGGRLGFPTSSSSTSSLDLTGSKDKESYALRAWGELSIGLAAPRSTGINHDNTSSLSFEMVKLMLDFGMAHALMHGIQRVDLQNPMAPSICSYLLYPLEVFTRNSVCDKVQGMADKEAADKKKAGKHADMSSKGTQKNDNTGTPRVSTSQRRESEAAFVEDAMLEDGFDAETAARNSRESIDYHNPELFDTEGSGVLEGDIVDYDMETVHSGTENEDDVDMEDNDDMEDDDDSSDESDEEITSDEESNESDGDSSDDTDDNDGEEEESEEDADGIDMSDIDDEDANNETYEDEEFFEGNINDEDTVDPNVGEGQELEEGWTRIESGGIGGMLMGNRQTARSGAGGGGSARSRGFIDIAEAMIGTLLRTGEIQGDALAEIEDTLGIRIMSNRNAPDLGDTDQVDGAWSRPTPPGRGGVSNRQNRPTRTGDGGVVGTLPQVSQRNPPDIGYSAYGGAGVREISSMEYVFGGPSVAGGSRNYDVVSPLDEPDTDAHPQPSQLDSQLFPGGPAASTHAGTRQSLHPLLCGVDLPPVNSLVSDLPPHGARAVSRGQTGHRRPGDWSSSQTGAGGYLVSTSSGNIIRLNRGQMSSQMGDAIPDRSSGGLVGWTDDGLPFDGTGREFSNAFGQAFEESLSLGQQQNSEADAPAESSPSPTTRNPEQANLPSEASTADENANEVNENDSGAAITSTAVERSSDAPQEEVGASENEQPPIAQQSNAEAAREVSGTSNEGDGMASSLARGLRLSPGSESGQQDQTTTGNVPNHETEREARRRSEDVVANEVPEASQIEDDQNAQQNEVAQESNAGGESMDSETIEGSSEGQTNEPEPSTTNDGIGGDQNEPNGNGLVCPPGMDLEVFNTLPLELQQEVVDQNRTASEVASQLDSTSALDPEALAALPEDMRREVIAQEQQERRLRDQAPADPSNAEEMDNANFVASLSPELREEILLTADDAFLNSLPSNIIAEAQVLRERASAQSRRFHQEPPAAAAAPRRTGSGGNNRTTEGQQRAPAQGNTGESGASGAQPRRKQRIGKIRVECDRNQITYLPSDGQRQLSPLLSTSEVQMLIRLLYLLNPVRPERLLQKVFQNLCSNSILRGVLTTAFVGLLNDDGNKAISAIATLKKEEGNGIDRRNKVNEEFSTAPTNFPPPILIGTAPEVLYSESNSNVAMHMFRRRPGSVAADSMAANLPTSARGSSRDQFTPPVVSTRIIDVLSHLSKNSPKVCLDVLASDIGTEESSAAGVTCFGRLLDLLEKPQYSNSSSNLDQLLSLVESFTSPLSHLPRDIEDELEVSQREIDTAAQAGKEWVDVPRIAVSQSRLQLLCSVLRMESCRDTTFVKVNTIARRLCRIEANRGCILAELASVAQALGVDAIRDLRALNIRLNDAITLHETKSPSVAAGKESGADTENAGGFNFGRSPSSSVTLSTSTSEVKLLRVLQTLQLLCGETLVDETTGRKQDGNIVVTEELVELLQGMSLDELWNELTQCLKVVQVLEGVATLDEIVENGSEGEGQMDTDDVDSSDNVSQGKKLQNSVAGLITRFLPTIEAFFVVNASATRDVNSEKGVSPGPNNEQQGKKEADSSHGDIDSLVGGPRLVDFVVSNKVLLNALVRNNPALLEKGLRAMVQVPRCRVFLDFDVKRQWFKTQVRRLRQHASRRHGSLRLSIRRKNVFEDAYHQLRIRNADEMRGRLHITFRNEEGVDAGGLSREFFGILAKEIFNPNYALFTSTEDGCTFQPNQHSIINPDHLSYFRFVGRIVGKAVADGFLLDAHFTRSLYKHMLGLKPTHHDMEAIDPDYYKNLKMIMEYNLADIGLDLTFSIEDHSFGRSQIIDLLPEGRKIPVTDETKAEYVSLVCQHRMTTAIQSQIKAYLDGFYELVSADLISIFTPKELELLISGLPDIDVHDLKKNTDYQGYKATDKEISWFWNILFSLSRSEKAAFLQFATGSSKVPLAGFSELQGMRGIQKFSIHKAGGAPGALMSAHTCFNSLDLPVYKSEDEMREKLLYAISEGATGFMFA